MQSTNQQGIDTLGSQYKSIDQMWEIELDPNNKNRKFKNKIGGRENWYSKQQEYWNNQDSSINGVLGGYENLHDPDIKHSQVLLKVLQSKNLGKQRVLDCGAGIGRITRYLLSDFFEIIDISDQNEQYLNQAKKELKDLQKIDQYILSGIQNLDIHEDYDCVWIQWVSNYLIDKDFIEFLKKCSKKLKKNGVIVVKENLAKQFVLDKDDASVTRTENQFKKLFEEAEMKIIQETYQKPWPDDMFQVKAFVLRPKQ